MISTETLYYDGKCALCSKEIKTLQRLKDSDLVLIDLHSLRNDEFTQSPKSAMLELLHLQTANGTWLTGLDATVQAWSHTKIGWLFKPLRWPVVGTVADFFYKKWASRRYCKLYE
ncbi:MAG: DUF393 domain-containing protein [Gammaproteobacteria bacterium]|nr:DUF393 domain-containing protein [Gammaproteobacteria bacterium]